MKTPFTTEPGVLFVGKQKRAAQGMTETGLIGCIPCNDFEIESFRLVICREVTVV